MCRDMLPPCVRSIGLLPPASYLHPKSQPLPKATNPQSLQAFIAIGMAPVLG